MARRIDLAEHELQVGYSGLSAAAVLAQELDIPYSSISSVRVGMRDLPGLFTFRVGTTTAPFGDTRRGTFWVGVGGRRVFLDLNDRQRAVVLELESHRYARVALGVDDPEALAAAIRERLGAATRTP